MNALTRFFAIGFAEADARWQAVMGPRSFEGVDGYLSASRIVRMFDAATQRLRDWSRASQTGTLLRTWYGQWQEQGWASTYRSIAIGILAAVTIHVVLTVATGPRPGWYWTIIPGLAAVLAVVVLSGSRSQLPH